MGIAEVNEIGALDRLCALTESYRYPRESEAMLQESYERVLLEHGYTFSREHRFNAADRVDFFVTHEPDGSPTGGIAVELKVHCGVTSVTRQLHRYAENAAVGSVVLVTCQMQHRAIPNSMLGKPVRVVPLWGSLF